jgi:hypothetical protein
MASRAERQQRNEFFDTFALVGSSDPNMPALYNKTHASLDDLESLLFSPVALRFQIGDPDIPNIVNEAKGRSAASRIRKMFRQTDLDSLVSQAVGVALRKASSLIKLTANKRTFTPTLIQPEDFGVMHENHTKLDADMEAFNHRMLITPSQFMRLIKDRPDETELKELAKTHMNPTSGQMKDASAVGMNVTTGGMYPFQPQGSASPATSRGVVDWMQSPKPYTDPSVSSQMLEMDELYVWDDERNNWATFQIIGDNILIAGKYQTLNVYSYNSEARQDAPELIGDHPFNHFCVNPMPGYFWGFSEVTRLVLLQEAINSRLTGINKLLRKQEDPATKFVGSTGVNQVTLSRYNKPGGYFTDTNPNAKIERDNVTIPADLWGSMHEYERMFDEMMGLPPVAKGQGEAGVRSAQHAETLVRMFSPRFKDRALLVERDVERLGGSFLELARVHLDEKLFAWVPKEQAGVEDTSTKEELKLLIPPVPGTVPVMFTFGDLPSNVTLTIDAHSSSPAFSADAKALAFDLVKVGAMDAAQLVDHVDAPDPDELRAAIQRRDVAKAEAAKAEQQIKLLTHMKTGKK